MPLQEERNLLGCSLCSTRHASLFARKNVDAIARGEEPPWGGRYAPPADPCVANPPTIKATKKAKHSSSHRKND
jgi:hypothetical protein